MARNLIGALVLCYLVVMVGRGVQGQQPVPTAACSDYCYSVGTTSVDATPSSAGGMSCVCHCRNQFQGLQCESCPYRYGGTFCDRCAAGRENFPDCSSVASSPPGGVSPGTGCQDRVFKASPTDNNCGQLVVTKILNTCHAAFCSCMNLEYDPYLDRCLTIAGTAFAAGAGGPNTCPELQCMSVERECQLSMMTGAPELSLDACKDSVLQRAREGREYCDRMAHCLNCNGALLCSGDPLGFQGGGSVR